MLSARRSGHEAPAVLLSRAAGGCGVGVRRHARARADAVGVRHHVCEYVPLRWPED